MKLNIFIVCMAVLVAAVYQTSSRWWPSPKSHDNFWPTLDSLVHSEEFVSKHNSRVSWKAALHPRFQGLTLLQAQRHLGALHLSSSEDVPLQGELVVGDVPPKFNASDYWYVEYIVHCRRVELF